MGNCFLYKRGFGGGFGGGGGGGEDVPVVEKTALGKVIAIHDSMEKPLKGLRLFGKTTQNGTPSPDAPIPLVIAGDGGSIAVKIGTSESDANAQTLTVSTPNGLPGIHVSDGGNYTDENGWQWICDEVDFARGVYVQRVAETTLTANDNWIKSAVTYLDRFVVPLGSVQCITNAGWCTSYIVGRTSDTIGRSYLDNAIGYARLIVNHSNAGENDLTSFRASIPSDGIKVLWILATPIETDLTAEQLAAYAALHTNYPSTTIYNDADSYMEVKYMAKGG